MGLLKKKDKDLDEIQKEKAKDFEKKEKKEKKSKEKGKPSLDLSFDKKRLTGLIILLVVVLLGVAGFKFGPKYVPQIIAKVTGKQIETEVVGEELPKILTNAMDYKGRWSEKYMTEMVKRNILLETGLTTLSPEAPVVRSQYMVALYTLDNGRIPIQEDKIIYFADVLDNFFYTNAINWGSSNGFITGIGQTPDKKFEKFAPNYEVKKQEAFFILYMYYCKVYNDENDYSVINVDFDETKVSNYARNAVKWAYMNGLMSFLNEEGIKNKKIVFTSACTREEVAGLLYNYIVKIDENKGYNCNTVYENYIQANNAVVVEPDEEPVEEEQLENTDENVVEETTGSENLDVQKLDNQE